MLLFHFHGRLCKEEQFIFHLSPLDLAVMFWILDIQSTILKAMVRQYFSRNFYGIRCGLFYFPGKVAIY